MFIRYITTAFIFFFSKQVKVELTYPREALYLYYYLRHVTKCIRYISAGFFKNDVSETTICSPFPMIPGYDTLCNYTDTSYINKWYCGKPRKSELSCADWKTIRDLGFFGPFPLRTDEMLLVDTIVNKPKFRLIPNVLSIDVNNGVPAIAEEPCPTRFFSETWDLFAHRGYFLDKKWHRTDCRAQPHTLERIEACLTNTTLQLVGDSNLVSHFYTILERLRYEAKKASHWHKPRSSYHPDIDFRLSWHLHGRPNHDEADHWSRRSDTKYASDVINSVPSKGRHIVVVHLYSHYSIHHYRVLYDRLQAVRSATESLLRRNPDALVVIKGPHTETVDVGHPVLKPIHLGDMMAQLVREMMFKAFRGLHDRVVYLDLWDMSLASENKDIHPADYVKNAMVDVLMDHVCAN